jgi:hypothetical protein
LIDRCLALNPSSAAGWHWSGVLRLLILQVEHVLEHTLKTVGPEMRAAPPAALGDQLEVALQRVTRVGRVLARWRPPTASLLDPDQLAGVDGAEAQRASCGRIRLGARSTVTPWRSAGSTPPDTSGSDWRAPAGS